MVTELLDTTNAGFEGRERGKSLGLPVREIDEGVQA